MAPVSQKAIFILQRFHSIQCAVIKGPTKIPTFHHSTKFQLIIMTFSENLPLYDEPRGRQIHPFRPPPVSSGENRYFHHFHQPSKEDYEGVLRWQLPRHLKYRNEVPVWAGFHLLEPPQLGSQFRTLVWWSHVREKKWILPVFAG